jgi:hypothetical protein
MRTSRHAPASGRRQSRTTPTPTTTANYSHAAAAPARIAPAGATPTTSSEATVDAGAMKTAATELAPRRSVGSNESCDR